MKCENSCCQNVYLSEIFKRDVYIIICMRYILFMNVTCNFYVNHNYWYMCTIVWREQFFVRVELPIL
jgi:hypothetical protein